MDEYYGYNPKKVPFVPITITGFMCSQSYLVASMIHKLTGLSHIVLDHWVEHKAGKNIVKIISEHGESHMRYLETNLLNKVLKLRPPGIISLGDGTLINGANQELINEASVLVYIKYDAQDLIGFIENHQKSPKRHHQFQLKPSITIKEIERLLKVRLPGYQKADFIILGAGKSATKLARQIISILDL